MELNMGAFKTLLSTYFKGNQSQMAKALGVNKTQINIILHTDGKKAGKKVFAGLMKFCIKNNFEYMDYIFLL